jgi:hypothetical protein
VPQHRAVKARLAGFLPKNPKDPHAKPPPEPKKEKTRKTLKAETLNR